MPRREGQVIPRGDDTFLIRLYLGEDPKTGRRRYCNETFHGSEAKAHKRLREKLSEKDAGRHVEPSKLTLGEHLDNWLKRIALQVQPRTATDYAYMLDRYVRPYLGERRISGLTFEHLEEHYADMLQKQGLAPRTVIYTHRLLHSAFADAVKRKLIAHSPVVYAEPPRQQRKEFQVLSEVEAPRFLTSAAADQHGALFTLALTTGLRPEEYFGLQWEHVHLERGIVAVRRTLVRQKGGGWYFSEPKTERSRRNVKLPLPTLRALIEHRKRQAEVRLKAGPAYQQNNLVFATDDGSPLSIRNVTLRHYRPILTRAGITKHLRLYDLRHSFATLSLLAGVHAKVVSEALGHASVAFTMDTYAHVLPSMQESAAEKIATLLFG